MIKVITGIHRCGKPYLLNNIFYNHLLDSVSLSRHISWRELNVHGTREANVHLAAGLPLTWVRKQREDFRAYLLRKEYVSFRFNGKEYKLHFGVD